MMTHLRMLFQRNLPAKLIALVVAVVLWLFVMNEQNPQIEGSFTVAVNLLNAPDGYKITQEEKSVKIKVRGARSFFVSAEPESFKAYADLAGLDSGEQRVKVKVVLPQGFELVDTQPENVSVTLDKIVRRSVRVDLIVTGSAAAGYTVAKISQAATSAVIEGPESRVSEVDRIIGYVGLSGNREDFITQVPLTPINSDGKAVEDVDLLSRFVEVSVPPCSRWIPARRIHLGRCAGRADENRDRGGRCPHHQAGEHRYGENYDFGHEGQRQEGRASGDTRRRRDFQP